MTLPALGSISSPVSRLAPEKVAARAGRAGRLRAGFGSRFFVALLAGLVWTGPAWWDHRFIYALPAWDLVVVLVWLADLLRLPKPEAIEVAREWARPLGLGEKNGVTLRVRSAGPGAVWMSLEDDLPPEFNPLEPARAIQLGAAA